MTPQPNNMKKPMVTSAAGRVAAQPEGRMKTACRRGGAALATITRQTRNHLIGTLAAMRRVRSVDSVVRSWRAGALIA